MSDIHVLHSTPGSSLMPSHNRAAGFGCEIHASHLYSRNPPIRVASFAYLKGCVNFTS